MEGGMTIVLIDFGGFLISLFSLFVVAESSSVLLPTLRRGVLNLMWGLGAMSLSFAWRVVGDFTPSDFFRLGDRFLMLVGIVLFFLAVLNLFRVHRTHAEVL